MMLFGGLFMAFTVYRMYYPHAFDQGSADMDILLGSINTAVLICSSFTMALAVHSAAIGNRSRSMLLLLATAFIGVIFLGDQVHRVLPALSGHKAPGVWFDSDRPDAGADANCSTSSTS